ncbi:MarR family transcriptional regulator [Burkholderia aenigmatica]|uniref:MarR family winged helix-turn-helix transcriptional regulator n=1 Tax=Burkholderia aenigmatica TaxID=2015348 RepID=UPI001F0071BD|nr:MarR family transcriptional regulator [Burkholderia aenigmatica]UKD14566.1 MarR family transcriptional regulator [Burkholderia aenigmatica]
MANLNDERILSITTGACLVDGTDAAFRCLVNGLLPFAVRLQSVRDGFGSLIGLTGIQYALLTSIAHFPPDDAVTVDRLADQLHLSVAYVTIETDKLRKYGLVEKQRRPEDRRSTRLTITSAGSALLRGLARRQQDINNVLFEGITSAEFKVLCSLVDRLVINGDRATLDLNQYLADLGAI